MNKPLITADLVRHMQWWILQMLADEAVQPGTTGLPTFPDMDDDTAHDITAWVRACADTVDPNLVPAGEA